MNSKKWLVVITIFLALMGNVCVAQVYPSDEEYAKTATQKQKQPASWEDIWDRTVIGGSLGASFSDITIAFIQPTIGYLIQDWWLAGIGGNYTYYDDKLYNIKYSVYGGKLFTEFFPIDPIVLHAESELLFLNQLQKYDPFIPATNLGVLVGGGLRTTFSGGYANILVLFNIADDAYNIYPRPVIRVGIGFSPSF